MKKQMFVSLFAILLLSLLQSNRCEAAAYAYVANSFDGTVLVIDTATHTVITDPIHVGNNPSSVAVSPTGDYVFVVNRGDTTMSPPIPSKIKRIKTSDNSIYKPIGGNNNLVFQGIAVSADGKYFYVTATKPDKSGLLYIINTYSNSYDSITVGKQPLGLVAFTKNNLYYAYVANQDSGTVSVIKNASVAATVDIGDNSNPTGVAVSPDLDYVYVTNSGDDTVSVIKTSDNTTINPPINVGVEPIGIAVISKGDNLHDIYVANGSSVSIIQIETGTEHTVIKTDSIDRSEMDQPYGVSATPNGEYVYVTNNGAYTVSVIQTSNNMVIETIPVGQGPTSLGNFIGSISPPNAPTDFAATSELCGAINLIWTDTSSDELGFRIERKAEGDANYSELDTVLNNIESYSDTEVSGGTIYNYRLSAFNGVGGSNYSEDSATAIPLPAPTGLSADADSDTEISLSWTDNSSCEDGFEIERKLVSSSTSGQTGSDSSLGDTEGETDSDSGGSYSVIATVGANVTSYTDTGLEKNATYSYRVRAFRYSTSSGSGLGAGVFGEESNQEVYSSYSNEAEEKPFDHCFIATAAYGSLMEPHVAILRQFRNKHLTPYKAGRALVETYYTYSPPIADFIAQHETLRAAVRIGLMPLVALSYSVLHIGPVFTLGILIFIMLLSIVSFRFPVSSKKTAH